MSENNCAVYVHVNLINGKKYFGITTVDPEKRWKNGKGYSKNDHFTNAINKYGWKNFAHLVLYENIPIKIAKNIEEMLILEHMSYDPHFGYNKTYGGELEKHTKETRQKIGRKNSIALKEYYENNPEAREAQSKARKELYAKYPEKHPMLGKHHSEEAREKISKNNHWNGKFGADNPLSKDVLCIETGIIYNGIHEADRITGINFRNISSVCLGRRKTAGGFHWRYINEEVDDDGNY